MTFWFCFVFNEGTVGSSLLFISFKEPIIGFSKGFQAIFHNQKSQPEGRLDNMGEFYCISGFP